MDQRVRNGVCVPIVNFHVLCVEEEDCCRDERDIKVLGVYRHFFSFDDAYPRHLGELSFCLGELQDSVNNLDTTLIQIESVQ